MDKETTPQEETDIEMRNIIEEARVILPGIQALFGFQVIAVFNDRFEELAMYAKTCHLLGLVVVVVAIGMVMTPAIHYRTCSGHTTRAMVKLSSRMIRGALAPLAIGLALDMFVVLHLATRDVPESLAISIGTSVAALVMLLGLWYVLPRRAANKV